MSSCNCGNNGNISIDLINKYIYEEYVKSYEKKAYEKKSKKFHKRE